MVTKQPDGSRLSITPHSFVKGRRSGKAFMFVLVAIDSSPTPGNFSVALEFDLKDGNRYAYENLDVGIVEANDIGDRTNHGGSVGLPPPTGGILYNFGVRPGCYSKRRV